MGCDDRAGFSAATFFSPVGAVAPDMESRDGGRRRGYGYTDMDKRTVTKRYKSEALEAAHEAVLGLGEAGVISKQTMRVFDGMCLTGRRRRRDRPLLTRADGPHSGKKSSIGGGEIATSR